MILHRDPGALGELRKLSFKLSEYKGVIEYFKKIFKIKMYSKTDTVSDG